MKYILFYNLIKGVKLFVVPVCFRCLLKSMLLYSLYFIKFEVDISCDHIVSFRANLYGADKTCSLQRDVKFGKRYRRQCRFRCACIRLQRSVNKSLLSKEGET